MHLTASHTLEAFFEELVALDRKNMETYFLAAGDRFDTSKRLRSLHHEWQEDAEFFICSRDGAIAGYLECMPNASGGLAVRSLQTDPRKSRQVTLRALLGAACAGLASTPFVKITSAAHPSNGASIKFHHALGFQIAGRRSAGDGGERILFEARVDALRQRLARFVRATNSVERISRKNLLEANSERRTGDAV